MWPASANPLAKTHAVWITNDGKDLYRRTRSRILCRSSTRRQAICSGVHVGSRPSEVLVTRDRKTAYVTVRNENKVKVLDISGDSPVLVGETFIGFQPDTMQITNDGRTLVVGLRAIPQMALMDTQTLEVRTVTFPGFGISGHEWLSANEKFTYIAVESTNSAQLGAIAVVENDSGDVRDLWTYPGGPWPHGVFYEPQVLR